MQKINYQDVEWKKKRYVLQKKKYALPEKNKK